MGQNYVCDLCQQVAADFMITTIQDGSVVAVGIECLLEWAVPLAEVFHQAQERELAVSAAHRGAPADSGAEVAGVSERGLDPAYPDRDGPQEPTDGPDGESGGGESAGAPRARKRGRAGPGADGRQDATAEAAPDVAG